MHLTKGTEQAICIMIMLYIQDRNVHLSSREISERLDISPTYLKKIMRKLVLSKLVKANPGVGGGYKYRPKKKVTFYQIYKAINGKVEIFVLKSDYIKKIFTGVRNTDSRYEEYLKNLNAINRALEEALDSFSIDDVVANILKENAGIKLDWNNWEEELANIYKKMEEKGL